ncbi:MAG: DNA-processing protein DprA [Simkania sp.]|nr:DNA-processing protein DprA [Simkania sp.]
MEELSALLAMQLAFPWSPLRAKALIEQWGSAKALWQERIEPTSPLYPILQTGAWKQEMDAAQQAGIRLIGCHDAIYPTSLHQLPDPPLVLYCKGHLLPHDQNALAIIGTRKPSSQGLMTAETFGHTCARSFVTVISGLAKGIDTAAHQGALQTGRTIAVLGSGLQHIYPKENRALAEKISQHGALLSEYPLHTPPKPFQFPRRNRLIAALSLGALLVEGALNSGSMQAMHWAWTLKKMCFTLHPSPREKMITGNQFLLENQKAKLVENAEEMLSLLVPQQRSIKVS